MVLSTVLCQLKVIYTGSSLNIMNEILTFDTMVSLRAKSFRRPKNIIFSMEVDPDLI